MRNEDQIYRLLHLEGDLDFYRPFDMLVNYRRRQHENAKMMEDTINMFSPDIIFVWGMWSMSKLVPALAERLMPSRVVYFLSDYWPAAKDPHTKYWQSPPRKWLMHIPKRILCWLTLSLIFRDTSPILEMKNTICVSRAVKDILIESGIPIENSHVIHGGTDVNRFPCYQPRNFKIRPLTFLYAGQIVEHKGVHTAIEALSLIVNQKKIGDVKLIIAGSGHPHYEKRLHKMVAEEELQDYVTFLGLVPKADMPVVMQRSQVLIFPSIYEEPFARMTQEAMLSGLVVIGTTTGGTKEILWEGENGLIYQPEDAVGLATQIGKLIDDPSLCQRLAVSGRETVLNNFTLSKMVDQIEAYLLEVKNEGNMTPRHRTIF
jgi:glycosyltransferase involved in cell wall biosynthesis